MIQYRSLGRLWSFIRLNQLFFFHFAIRDDAVVPSRGDLPPPCHAHSTTLIGRKIVIVGSGEDASYYNSVYVLDIPTPRFTTIDVPPPHRVHITVLYRNKDWAFGGGDGVQALNDVWTPDKMRLEQVTISGRK